MEGGGGGGNSKNSTVTVCCHQVYQIELRYKHAPFISSSLALTTVQRLLPFFRFSRI